MAEAQASTIADPHHHHKRWFHVLNASRPKPDLGLFFLSTPRFQRCKGIGASKLHRDTHRLPPLRGCSSPLCISV